jgi:hypothetical protein
LGLYKRDSPTGLNERNLVNGKLKINAIIHNDESLCVTDVIIKKTVNARAIF